MSSMPSPLLVDNIPRGRVALTLESAKEYSPYEGARLERHGAHSLDVLLRVKGTSAWHHGATAHSATLAWTMMNYIRRDKLWLDVDIRRTPIGVTTI